MNIYEIFFSDNTSKFQMFECIEDAYCYYSYLDDSGCYLLDNNIIDIQLIEGEERKSFLEELNND